MEILVRDDSKLIITTLGVADGVHDGDGAQRDGGLGVHPSNLEVLLQKGK